MIPRAPPSSSWNFARAPSRKDSTSCMSTVPIFSLMDTPVGLAVTGRAPGVAHEHRVAGRGVDLGLVEQGRRVLREGSAVDVEQDGVRAFSGRQHQPAVDRVAVGRIEGQLLGLDDLGLKPEFRREIRQQPQLAVLQRGQVPGGGCIGETDEHVSRLPTRRR